MNGEQLIHLLVLLSISDQDLSTQELAYILNVAQRVGMDQEQVEHILRNPQNIDLQVPSTERERMEMFYYFLFLMKIDSKVDDKEAELVQHFGFKLGFSRSMINDFIDVIRNHSDKRVPTELMIDIIKKYQN